MKPQFPDDEQDAFDEFFRDIEALPATRPDLAESIFTQTRGVLTRRRWVRRTRYVVAGLFCYLVGMGSGWWLKPDARQVAGQPNLIQPAQTQPVIPQAAPQVVADSGVANIKSADTPSTVKISGVPHKSDPFENFRRAGDRQLFERGNVKGAIDCYRRALSHANEQQLRIELDRDSWLLMSLKQSRMEERKHARQKRA